MTTLASAVSIGDNQLIIDAPLAQGLIPGWVKIDTELLNVGGQHYRTGVTLVLSAPAMTTHSLGATVTSAGRPYDAAFLAATAGGGGGAIAVDNTVDAPVEVTTIVAPGATFVGDEATLTGGFVVAADGSLSADFTEATLEGPAFDILLPDNGRFGVLGAGGVVIDSIEPATVGLTLTVPDDQSSPRMVVEDSAAAFSVLAKGNVQWTVAVGAAHVLRVFDELGNVVFQINADGTVHILTGGSIVADL